MTMIRRGGSLHSCHDAMPYANMCRTGSVWMCDDCGRLWILASGWGAPCWQKIYNPLRVWWLKRASK